MMRRQIPLIITFLSGLVLVIQYYFSTLNHIGDTVADWFQAISAFAYVLGAASLVVVNGRKIQRQSPGWFYNLVLLLSLFITLYVGMFNDFIGLGYPGHNPVTEGTTFDWLFQYVHTPLSATMFSLLAFFIASAAYRAFKARSIESTLLLGSAFLVMIFRVPLGELIWNESGLGGWFSIGKFIDDFIMGGFNVAGQRAIQVAAAIGLISVSLKIMLGIERSYLGGD